MLLKDLLITITRLMLFIIKQSEGTFDLILWGRLYFCLSWNSEFFFHHWRLCVCVCLQLCSERRAVRHYWFTSWPDHHIPQCIAPLLRLVEEVETYSRSRLPPSDQPFTAPDSGAGPVIVHCRLVQTQFSVLRYFALSRSGHADVSVRFSDLIKITKT